MVLQVQGFWVEFEGVVLLGFDFGDGFEGEVGWGEVIEGQVWVLVVLVEGYYYWQFVFFDDVIGFVDVVYIVYEQVNVLYIYVFWVVVVCYVVIGVVVEFGVEEVGMVFVSVCVILVEVYYFEQEVFQFWFIFWGDYYYVFGILFVGQEVGMWVIGNE